VKPLILTFALLLSACAATPARKISSNDNSRLQFTSRNELETALVGEITVVRADPAITPLSLFNPPDTDSPIGRFAGKKGLLFATNAAMFGQDYATSIGYMRNFAVINNAHIASKLQGFLLFHPRNGGLPNVKIGTRDDLEGYDTAFQTYRMWDPVQGILWKEGASIYMQVALVGVDKSGRVLFFFHPNLIDVHEMVAQILDLGLDLEGLLYLDGGHHGALYLGAGLGQSHNAWITLPNVLGISPR
jgi:uncharacterized protein YigE (DUF2233 family)